VSVFEAECDKDGHVALLGQQDRSVNITTTGSGNSSASQQGGCRRTGDTKAGLFDELIKYI